MGFLSDLVTDLRRRLEREPLDDRALLARARVMPPARDFEGALGGAEPPAVIAEVKRRSPSAGDIGDADPGELARAYEDGGAAAISVLTEGRHFGGTLADLRAARMRTRLPVLRKDFLIHPAQVIEARAAGADAVLLIAAAVSATELRALLEAASDLRMAALVETHSEGDLDAALGAGASIVGINARDLETLDVDEDRALSLLRRIPDGHLAVFESGISTRAQVRRAVDAGARAVLVGEALMRAGNPAAKLRALRGVLAPVSGVSAHDEDAES